MSLITTIDEHNHRIGNNFVNIFTTYNSQFGDKFYIAICPGIYDISVKSIQIGGTSSFILFDYYYGVDVDLNTGTEINELPMNETVISSSGSKMLLNPVIIDPGVSILTNPAELLGMTAFAGRCVMERDILTEKLVIKKNTKAMMILDNQHSGGSSVNLTVYYSKIDSHIQ